MDRLDKSPRGKESSRNPSLADDHDDVNTFIKSVENSTRKMLQQSINRRRNKYSSSTHSTLGSRTPSLNHAVQAKLKKDESSCTVESLVPLNKERNEIQKEARQNATNDSIFTEKGKPTNKQWRKATKELMLKGKRGKCAIPELSSRTLRSKYRCIHRNYHVPSLMDSGDHLNTSQVKQDAKAALKQEEGLSPAAEMHPIYRLLQSHVRKENEKLKQLDDEVIKMKAASVLDRHAEWSSKIKSLGDSMLKEKKKISFNVEEEKAMFELEIEKEGLCRERAQTPAPSVIQKELYLDIEDIPSTFDPEHVPAPRIEKPNETAYRIAPEIWPLIVCEPLYTLGSSVDDHAILVSMYRVHERVSYDIHSKCFVYGEQPFWLVELYNEGNCTEDLYFCKESTMTQMIGSLPRGDAKTPGGKVLVHTDYEDMQMHQIQKTVFVHTDSMKTVASILLNITCKEGHDENTEPLSSEINVPVYEIVVRLKRHNTLRAMDKEPWYSSCGKESLWPQILNLIEIDLDQSTVRE